MTAMGNSKKDISNLRPPKDICLNCESHEICAAESGMEEYKCWKIFWLPRHRKEANEYGLKV